MKNITLILLTVILLLSFASCRNGDTQDNKVSQSQATRTQKEHSVSCTELKTETTAANVTEGTTLKINEETSVGESDPSEWSAEKTVEFYKAAASKSQSRTKSVKKMTLNELTVNDGDGALGAFIDFCMPFFIAALEKNSTEFDGITGGYESLKASDAKSIKAYKEGNCTVVEMVMKEQTDGAHGEEKSGTVGHAISVVGDLSVVEAEFPKLEIGFDDADISLKYSNPKLRVKINKDGIIESGEWSYTVCINIENLRIDVKNSPVGATVKKGYGEVDFISTVG